MLLTITQRLLQVLQSHFKTTTMAPDLFKNPLARLLLWITIGVIVAIICYLNIEGYIHLKW
jgi:hypothetical protein